MTRTLRFGLGLAVIWVAASPTAALAHAGFVSSTPTPGATLGTAPGQVTLTFTEPLNGRLSRAAVHAPDGSSVAGRVAGDDQIIVDLTTNQSGVYEVDWTTVSLVDGHTLSGSYRFGVGVSPGAGAEGGASDEPGRADLLIAVGRVVEDVGLLLVFGVLLLGRLARREPALTWVRTPTLLAFTIAFGGGVAVVLGEALRAAPSVTGGAIVAYLTTGLPGWSRLARVFLEGLGVLAAWRWPRTQAPLAVAAGVALAAAGHAAAITPRAWGVGTEAVHVVSAGIWVGGILALVLQRPRGGWLGETGRSLLDRFTPPALVAFAVTITTGAVRGVQEVGGLSQLFGSAYGVVLLVKAVLVMVVVQLSVLAWRRIAVFSKSESLAAVLVVAAAALLSAFPLPPARQVEAVEAAGTTTSPAETASIPQAGAITLGSHAGSVLVGLTIGPGEPGRNEMTIFVQTLDGPDADAALPVSAAVDGAPLALAHCGDRCREGDARLRGGEQVVVDVGSAAGGHATFQVPALPAPSGEKLLDRMQASMGRLSSYRLDEDLTSGLGTTVRSIYAFEAPNSFESTVMESGKAFRTIWIGDTRYTEQGNGTWKVERGVPAIPVPTYIWDSFRPFRDARVVGGGVIGSVQTTEVAFAGGDQQLPIWFRLWIDDQGLVHRAEMRAPGHFMDHRYHDFDAPTTIDPPNDDHVDA